MASAMALDSMDDDPSQLLTTADVSRLMGITQRAVRYLEEKEILRGHRLSGGGGPLVFKRSDVDEAIRKRANTKPRMGRPYKAVKVPTHGK